MRSSDWSSDVCYSDLRERILRQDDIEVRNHRERRGDDLVAVADADGIERRVQGRSAGIEGDRIFRADLLGERRLEAIVHAARRARPEAGIEHLAEIVEFAFAESPDRKSTRLNSSH